MELVKFFQDVQQELSEMKRIGMNVPQRAFERSKDLEQMAEYIDMKVSDCADLLISLG